MADGGALVDDKNASLLELLDVLAGCIDWIVRFSSRSAKSIGNEMGQSEIIKRKESGGIRFRFTCDSHIKKDVRLFPAVSTTVMPSWTMTSPYSA